MKWVREFGINRYFVIQKPIFGHIERTQNKVCAFPFCFTEITSGLCKHPCSSDEHSISLVALGSFWKEIHSFRLLLRLYRIKQIFRNRLWAWCVPASLLLCLFKLTFHYSQKEKKGFFLLESLLLAFITSLNFFLWKYMWYNIFSIQICIFERNCDMKIKRKFYRLL